MQHVSWSHNLIGRQVVYGRLGFESHQLDRLGQTVRLTYNNESISSSKTLDLAYLDGRDTKHIKVYLVSHKLTADVIFGDMNDDNIFKAPSRGNYC